MASGAESLSLRFEPDHDGTGKLLARASANGFCGESGAWFGIQELIDFAEALSAYPLPEAPVAIGGGFLTSNPPHALEQEHVGLKCYRVEGRGQVGISVHLAGELRPEDRSESVHEVRLEILTTYERLGQFAKEFISVIRGDRPKAVIEGERLA